MKLQNTLAPCAIEPLEARIAPAVDLLLKITGIVFPNVAVPGDTGTITMTIENIGDDVAKNTTDINIWLVPDPGAGQQPGDSVYNGGNFGRNTAKSMKIVEGEKDVPLNLKPVSEGGTPKIVTKKFTLPDLILGEGTVAPGDLYFTNDPGGPSVYHPFNMTPGLHYIVAEVDGGNENEPFFFSHQNNFAAPATPFDYQYSFGTVGSRSNVDLHATSGIFDTTTRTFPGASADFSLSGSGKGTISVVNATAGDPIVRNNLAFTGTSAASFAAAGIFKGANGSDRITLNNITADAAMKGIKLGKADITGNVNVAGALAGLELGNVGGDKAITLGGAVGSAPPATVTLGRVNNLNLTAPGGLASLEVVEWQDTGNADIITTPFITSLLAKGDKKAAIAGDFGAELFLSGADAKGKALGSATFAGRINNTKFQATGPGDLGDITAASANQWNMDVEGDVDDVVINGDMLGGTALGLKAKSFSSVKIAGKLNGHIIATGVNEKLVSIKSVTAKSIDGINISAVAGGIEKVETGEWINGGQLTAGWIKTLTTKVIAAAATSGDFTAGLTINGPSSVPSKPKPVTDGIGTATIAGALKSGTWTVKGDVNKLVAGSVEAGWTFNGSTAAVPNRTELGMLEVKGKVAGAFTAAVFRSIKFGGDFSGSITAGGSSALGIIFDMKAANVVGGTISADLSIETISARQWTGGSVNSPFIDEIKITGGGGLPGDFKNATVTADGTTGGRLKKVIVAGSLGDVTFNVPKGEITSIAADEWISTGSGNDLTAKSLGGLFITSNKPKGIQGDLKGVQIQLTDAAAKLDKLNVIGSIDDVTVNVAGDVGTVQAFAIVNGSNLSVDGTIDSLTIKGKGAVMYAASNVTADAIGKVSLNNVDASGTGADFGIIAGKIARYVRMEDGKPAKTLTLLDAPDSDLDTVGKYRLVIS